MDKNTRKAQVVVSLHDQDRQTFSFLLLKTTERRGEYWQNVTGKVEENETFEEAALREAMEETGLQVESIVDIRDLGISHQFTDQYQRKVNEKSFLIILDRPWEIKLDPSEHCEYRWLPLPELSPEVVKFEGNYEALQKSAQLLQHWGR